MNRILFAAIGTLFATSAFAMEPPVTIGDYSASVQSAMDERVLDTNTDTMTTASIVDIFTNEPSANAAGSTPTFPWEVVGGR